MFSHIGPPPFGSKKYEPTFELDEPDCFLESYYFFEELVSASSSL